MNIDEGRFEMIPIELLMYSGRNPRQEMRGIENFAENIKQYGIIEPITVRPRADKFEIVVGERRVRAAIIAGLKWVPACIIEMDDRKADELRLIENIHRDDLTSAEKGDAVYALLENYPDKYPGLTSISAAINIPRETLKSWCAHARKLCDYIKRAVESDRLSEDQASYLLKYNHQTQEKLAKTIIEYNLNSLQTRKFISLYDSNPDANLSDLASQAKGIQMVRIPLEELSEVARLEVKRLLEEKRQKAKQLKEKTIRKATEASAAKRKRAAQIKREALDEIQRLEKTQQAPAEIAQQLSKEVHKQIEEAIGKVPEKAERIVDIVTEEIRGLIKRLKIFPEKSQKIQPKFEKLQTLLERGVIPYTIWDFQYRDDYAGDKDFHGNCSPQIVEQCIWRLTEEGDLVLDPMAGSGTTLDVCRQFNRRCIGYDIKPMREDIIQNDSRNIPLESNSVDMIFIHPPYWNLTYYTKTEENLPDLSRAKTLEEYLEMLKMVFKECYRVLKEGKFMCVLLGDLIRDGKFIPLCLLATILATEIGFENYGYAVKLAHGEMSRKKSGVIIAESIYTDHLKISHDLVMFFRKPKG